MLCYVYLYLSLLLPSDNRTRILLGVSVVGTGWFVVGCGVWSAVVLQSGLVVGLYLACFIPVRFGCGITEGDDRFGFDDHAFEIVAIPVGQQTMSLTIATI